MFASFFSLVEALGHWVSCVASLWWLVWFPSSRITGILNKRKVSYWQQQDPCIKLQLHLTLYSQLNLNLWYNIQSFQNRSPKVLTTENTSGSVKSDSTFHFVIGKIHVIIYIKWPLCTKKSRGTRKITWFWDWKNHHFRKKSRRVLLINKSWTMHIQAFEFE